MQNGQNSKIADIIKAVVTTGRFHDVRMFLIHIIFLEFYPMKDGHLVREKYKFHPQTAGQQKRTIKVLGKIFWACVIDFGGQCN